MNDKPPTDANRFHAMGERITHNVEHGRFGGAAVIVPPGGGDPIEVLILDSQGDVAQFWSTIQTRIMILLKDMEDRKQLGFGRPR